METLTNELSGKTLDVTLSLLQTIRSLASIANSTNRNDAGQTLMVGPAPIETGTKALDDYARARISNLENELKYERATNEAHLQQIRDLQKLLDKENGSLFLQTPDSDDPFIKQSPKSPLDVKPIHNEGVADYGTKSAQDHPQELSRDLRDSRVPIDAGELQADLIADDFRSIEDILGGDDKLTVVSKRGLDHLESLTGSAAIHKHAPGVLEVGLDMELYQSGNKNYRFRDYHRRYEDRRPRHSINRFDPAMEDRSAFRTGSTQIISEDSSGSGYFKHGLLYDPPSHCFRTVHVGNLPECITAHRLLSRVRGGQITSVTICNTLTVTGSMSALVAFLDPEAANEYVEFSQKHPIVFGSRPAVITLVQTSTWPLSDLVYRRVTKQGQTRCLAILSMGKPGLPRNDLLRRSKIILQKITCDTKYRAYQKASLEFSWLDEDDKLQIHFCSIDAAALAFEILKEKSGHKSHTMVFVKDPCSRPLDDLLAPAGPRMDEINEIIPTDDFDLDDLDTSTTDTETTDLNYRHINTRQRYRDGDKAPAETVNELSYSDVSNTVVPQFGGSMTQAVKPNEVLPVRRVVPVRSDSESEWRRSWSYEMNGEYSDEDDSGALISEPVTPLESSPEAEVIPKISGSSTEADVVDVYSPPKSESDVVEVSKIPNGVATLPIVQFETEPKSLKDSIPITRSILESPARVQAQESPVRTPGANSVEGERTDKVSSTIVTPAPAKEAKELVKPNAAHISLNTEVFGSPKSPTIASAERPEIIGEAVRNPDEIDLGLESSSTSSAVETDKEKIEVSSSPPAVKEPAPSASSTNTPNIGQNPPKSRGLSSSIYATPSPKKENGSVGTYNKSQTESPSKNSNGRGLSSSIYATPSPNKSSPKKETGTYNKSQNGSQNGNSKGRSLSSSISATSDRGRKENGRAVGTPSESVSQSVSQNGSQNGKKEKSDVNLDATKGGGGVLIQPEDDSHSTSDLAADSGSEDS